MVPVTLKVIVLDPLPATQVLTVPPALAAATASVRLHGPGTVSLPPSSVLTRMVLARANPAIARNKTGSATAASVKRRFRTAMDPSPATPRPHWQIFSSKPSLACSATFSLVLLTVNEQGNQPETTRAECHRRP